MNKYFFNIIISSADMLLRNPLAHEQTAMNQYLGSYQEHCNSAPAPVSFPCGVR